MKSARVSTSVIVLLVFQFYAYLLRTNSLSSCWHWIISYFRSQIPSILLLHYLERKNFAEKKWMESENENTKLFNANMNLMNLCEANKRKIEKQAEQLLKLTLVHFSFSCGFSFFSGFNWNIYFCHVLIQN
jgi:hypothetical protein